MDRAPSPQWADLVSYVTRNVISACREQPLLHLTADGVVERIEKAIHQPTG
jgi:hypothetical protein